MNGDEKHACSLFESLLQDDPDHVDALLELGTIIRRNDKPRDALLHHLRAHTIQPDDPRIILAVVQDHRADGDIDAAIDLLRGVIAKRPKETRWAYRKIRNLCIACERWSEALEWQETLEQKTHEKPDPDLRAGIRYEQALEHAEGAKIELATRELRAITEEIPHFVPAYYAHGKLLLRDDEEADAIECWKEGYQKTRSPVFLTALEDYFLETEDPSRALEILREIANDEPDNPLPAFFLGRLFYRLEMLDDALEQFRSLESRNFHSPSLEYIVAHIHERREQFEDAMLSYRSTLDQIGPTSLPFLCGECSAQSSEWSARCPNCAQWNTIAIDFGREPSPEELGFPSAPVYRVAPN